MSKSINLSEILLDGGTQCRAALDQDHIATLADAWQDGAKMPAVVVFHDGSNYWLADGFHRYHAAQKCGFNDIEADVRSGTRMDAVKYALGANAAHGLRRTNADKRRAVEIALKEFPKLSSREIAKVCAVSPDLVDRTRPSVPESGTSPTRTDSAGRQQPAKKPAKNPVAPAPAAPVRYDCFGRRDLRTLPIGELPPRTPQPAKAPEPAEPAAAPEGNVVEFAVQAEHVLLRVSGTFRIRDLPYATRVATIIGAIREACDFGTKTQLIAAVSRVVRVKEFDDSQFLKRLKTYPHLLVNKPDAAAFVDLIDEIYNWRSVKRIPLAFLTKQVIASRCVVGRNPKSKPEKAAA